jgi:hypothetical protein
MRCAWFCVGVVAGAAGTFFTLCVGLATLEESHKEAIDRLAGPGQ